MEKSCQSTFVLERRLYLDSVDLLASPTQWSPEEVELYLSLHVHDAH